MEKEELELKKELKEFKRSELQRRKEQRSRNKNSNNNNNDRNTSIYISGLPMESTVDSLQQDLIDEFQKFGMIVKDKDGNCRCKVYRNEKDQVKGDALITYARPESVQLAINLMDGYLFSTKKIKVEVAQFNDKKRSGDNTDNEDENGEDDDGTLVSTIHSKKRIKRNGDISLPNEGKKIDISEDHETRKQRTLVLANVLDIYEDLDSEEMHDIESDIVDGCEEFGNIINHSMHVDSGEVHILFELRNDAISCRNKMNRRYFNGRKLLAYILEDENISESEEKNGLSSNEELSDPQADYLEDENDLIED